MIRLFACAALIVVGVYASPAVADDRAFWGPSYEYGTSVTLAPADGPAIATVTFRNRLTGNIGQTSAVLTIAGLSVQVHVTHASGDSPDRVMVTPPEGFMAVPPVLDVEEGGEGVVTIYSAEGAGA
jgi:hypothetical protein